MMHQNTTFGNKILGGLEDIIWTNINILTLCCDLDPECSNNYFHRTLASYDISSDQVWLPRNQQFRKYSRKSYFNHMSPRCDLDLKDSNNNIFFPMTLWLMILHHHTKFGTKMFCDSENIIQANIHWHFEPSP